MTISAMSICGHSPRFLCLMGTLAAPAAGLHAEDPDLALPPLAVYSQRVANQSPVATFAMPVSALRFEPRVDVQARNFAEGQADVSIRGGIFENTGFKVGAVPIYDPQTGHYFAELPIASAMLGAPAVATGSTHAMQGWNATAGSIAYGWQPIRSGGFASAGIGDGHLQRGEFYVAAAGGARPGGWVLAADVAVATSQADGVRPFGDHDFARYNGRLQLRGPRSQTDLFAGYQSKFFGWPQLYAGPFVSNESENLKTTLFVLNHRTDFDRDGEYLQFGAYYRRNVDDYEFNRNPPADAFLHTTWVRGAGLEGRVPVTEATALRYRAGVIADDLKSRSLTFGPEGNRTQTYGGVFGEHTLAEVQGGRELLLLAGANYDDSDRTGGSAVSPAAGLTLRQAHGIWRSLQVSYSESTQVPTYTALKSNPAGLFGGNAKLGRSTARNIELGGEWHVDGWRLEATAFFRRDDRLVDWTYSFAKPNARSANAVDLDTTGLELLAQRSYAWIDVVVGYTGLHRNDNYPGATASFYALNYARHRFTAAVIARLGGGFEVRLDNEARFQAENSLRRGPTEAVISSLGLYYRVPGVRRLSLSVQIDNLWNSSFEEVPLVPASPRQIAGGVTYAW